MNSDMRQIVKSGFKKHITNSTCLTATPTACASLRGRRKGHCHFDFRSRSPLGLRLNDLAESRRSTLFSVRPQWVFIATLLCWCVACPVSADEPTSDLSARALKGFQTEAGEYRITETDSPSALKLKTEPILRWTNPIKEGQDGAVFVWTRDERPEVIGCCFTYTYHGELRRKHQLHSLATAPLAASVEEGVVWQPKKAGLVFRQIPKAKPPAKSAARQAIQMRQFARRFSVNLEDDKQNKSVLRLMSVPLAKYAPRKGECQSGALFSFAQGTDPDAILVIENRLVDSKPTWMWAIARFHYYKVTATLDKKPVWTAPAELGMKGDARSNSRYRNNVYVSFKP